ncbi:MAG TPA: hypothetical protein P5079_04780 [Elusimicrobiota bacterium]|nr:hypothetical protein [Elusimicrobiota bacterium]
MKKTLIVMFLAVVFATTSLLAGHPGKQSCSYKAPEVVPAIGFEAKMDNGRVVARWKKYNRPDFKYYKLVRSSTNANPVYPEDGYIFVGSQKDQTSYVDESVESGQWYYRVCVITTGGQRWVSPVVTLTVSDKSGGVSGGVPTSADFE